MKTFYLQNQSGLFLTNDKKKISVEEQDFSNNQVWHLSDNKDNFTNGKLFCGNGTCLSAQWGQINVEGNSADEEYENLKFYFHEVEDGKFYIGHLEDKGKKFEGDEKQRFLAVIDGRSYMGPIEDALENAEKASIADFTWKKVSPQQSTYEWVRMPNDGVPENAFSAGEEKGLPVIVGRGFTSDGHPDHARLLHVGKVCGYPVGSRFIGCHDENQMANEAFFLQSESGLYLTSFDFNSLTLEKLNFLPTQIWYWDYSYDFEKERPGPIKNELRCASGNCLYMQQEDAPESIVYSSESTSEDNRHKFYSREIEDGNILIGKFTEKGGEKEAGAFVGFCSQGYFKMGKPSKDSDMQFKWKKVPVNQAYKWNTLDEASASDIPKDALSIDDKKVFIGRAEVNGVIHPGTVSGGACSFGGICDGVYYKKYQNRPVTYEKFSVLCAEPETEVEWVEMPDIKHPSRAYNCDYSKFPKNAVIGGVIDGRVYYVGRAVLDNRVTPGFFAPKYDRTKLQTQYCESESEKIEVLIMRKKDEEQVKTTLDEKISDLKYFGVDNAEREVVQDDCFDILCVHPDAELDWVEYEDGKLPNNAVIAGLSDDGIIPTGIYYVGRGIINNETIPGIFLHKKTSRRERSEAKEHMLYALQDGKLHHLKKFQVLVVKKHVEEKFGAPEKASTASGVLKDDWKLIGTGDLPTGFEIIEISENNFSEHSEKIRSLTLKALEDGTIKFAKKRDGNANLDVKPKDEASLGDLVGALGSLMTAFAPKEEAEKMQEQVDMMAGLLTSVKIEPSAPEKPQEEDATILCDLSPLPPVGPTEEEKAEQAKKEEKMINDGIMIVKIDPPHYTIMKNEEEKHLPVTIVRRGGDINTHVVVDYKTEDGRACAERDYEGCCGTLCYSPGETEKKVDLQVKHDDIFRAIGYRADLVSNFFRGDRHFYLRINNVRFKDGRNIGEIESTNDAGDVIKVPSIQVGSANCATITILDDDHGGVFTFEKPEVEIDQSDSSVDLKLLRKKGARGWVCVAYETEGGTARCDRDFEFNKGEVEFRNNETEKIITINLHVGFYKEDVVMYVHIGDPPRHIAEEGLIDFAELDCKDPSELTKDERIALLGRPVVGDFTTVTIRIKESKRVQGKSKKKQSSATADNAPETLKFESKGPALLHRENKMGTYAKTDQIIQGCPVFHQEVSPPGEKYYLFVGPNGCWRVGPDVTSYSGSVLKNPKKHKKVPPKSGWLYYNNDKWNKDESLELVENNEVSDGSDDNESDENLAGSLRQKEEVVKTAFAKADTKGTGKLTIDQLKVALGELIESGFDAAFITEKQMLDDDDTMRMFIEVADRDGDKLLNLNELLMITDENLDFKEMFTKLVKAADKDGTGLITAEELKFLVMKSGLGDKDDNIDECVSMFMSMADLDGDKKLKIAEVVSLFTDGPPEEDSRERMKRMFKMYDTNEDGFISKKELLEYVKSMGFVDEDDTPEEVTFMVNMLMVGADEDHDGKLSYEEFCSILP